MRAYKFLDRDGRTLFTRTQWEPGSWVESGAVALCDEGVHALRPADLSYWLDDELWEIEIDGDVVESRHKIVASRGRLERRIDGYPEAVRDLAEVGAWRCRDRAVPLARAAGADELAGRLESLTDLDDLAALGEEIEALVDVDTHAGTSVALAVDAAHFAIHGRPSQSPFVACCSAGHAAAGAGGDRAAYDDAYAEERRFQSDWLTDRLSLTS